MFTINFIEEHKYSEARSLLFSMGIGCNEEKDGDRMILYHLNKEKISKNFDNPIVKECNGLVLTKQLHVLCMPIPAFTPMNRLDKIKKEYTAKYINDYDLIKIQNGSIINLYFYNGKWVVSTMRGYEMNNVKWFGTNMTFSQVFDECGGKDLYEKLDTKKCYTFNISHPKMHVLTETLILTQVAEYDLANNESVPLSLNVSPQIKLEKLFNFWELISMNKTALDNAVNNKGLWYGFILKDTTGKHKGDLQNMIFESSLMKAINAMVNHKRYNELSKSANITREQAIVLYNYLEKNMFIRLLPHYSHEFQRFDTIANEIVLTISELKRKAKFSYPKHHDIAKAICMKLDKKINAKLDHTLYLDQAKAMVLSPNSFYLLITPFFTSSP